MIGTRDANGRRLKAPLPPAPSAAELEHSPLPTYESSSGVLLAQSCTIPAESAQGAGKIQVHIHGLGRLVI